MKKLSFKNVYWFLFLFFAVALTDYAIAYVATLAMPGSDVATVFIAILVAQAVILTWNKEVEHV